MARTRWIPFAFLLLAVAAVTPPAVAEGPTYVSGNVSGVWDAVGSPYVALENLTVPAGQTLTILPGVRVNFTEGHGLRVLGALQVLGNETDRVLFTANTTLPPAAGNWSGVSLEGPGSTLQNLTVEGTEVAVMVKGVAVDARSLGISHSFVGLKVDLGSFTGAGLAFSALDSLAVSAGNATVDLSTSRFSQNLRGFTATDSAVSLTDSAIEQSLAYEFDLTRSSVVLMNTTRQDLVVFHDATSSLLERARLRVRVLDSFSTTVAGATVTITDNANGTFNITAVSDTDGGIGDVDIDRTLRTMAGSKDYIPVTIDAAKGATTGQATSDLLDPRPVPVSLVGDFSPPAAAASVQATADEDTPVALDATPTTDNDPTLDTTGNFTWSSTDGRKLMRAYGSTTSYAWETPGNYTITLTVRDAAGNADTTLLAIAIADRTPPEVRITAILVLQEGVTTTLEGNATDNDPAFPIGAAYTWTITGPVNATLTGLAVNHTYPLQGRYEVIFTATDASGNVNSTRRFVDVAATPGPPDLNLLTLVLSAAAFLTGAWFGGTDRGWTSLLFLFMPLYTRIKDDKVLDQFTRGQVFGYIRVHPGDSFTDIKRNLQLENGVLAYHLSVLEKENLLRSRTKGARRLYYPIEAVPLENGGLHDLQERMLDVLRATPGLTVRELGTQLGVSRQLAVYHLRTLTSRGLAKVDRQGLKMKCYPGATPVPSRMQPET